MSELAEREMAVRSLKDGPRVRQLFVVGITAARGSGGAEARNLREIYADNPNLIRKPRSFKGERERQTLRWLSTALRHWSLSGIEIQAYYDPDKDEIWVSSNVDEVNKKLQEFLSSGGLIAELAALDEALDHGRHTQTNRTYRQMSKLKRMIDDPSLQPIDEARKMLKAMARGRFRVPPALGRSKGGSRPVNLHSELRIRDAFLAETGHPPDPQRLTGTRRPCGVCAKDLDLPPHVRRGPIWLSRASRVRHDPEALAEANAKAAIPTFITQKRNGHWTADHNTDSESDLEEPVAKHHTVPTGLALPAKRRARDDAGRGRPVPERTAAPVPPSAENTGGSRLMATGAPDTLGKRTADGQPVSSAWSVPQGTPDLAAAGLGRPIAAERETEIAALQEHALDAVMLLNRQVEFPVPREKIGPLLQGLLDEGRRRFDEFRAQMATHPGAQATSEQRQEMRQLGELSLRVRRSAGALGWLPTRASPTAALPPGFRWPADADWARPMRELFTPGSASGARNICWFDTLAQLALDESRDLGGDMRLVESLAAELRAASDRLGLTEAGAMADDDHGALQLIAHALGVQVHVFLRLPDGRLTLSELASVGAPGDKPVYVYSDDTHFEPLWPAWAQGEER